MDAEYRNVLAAVLSGKGHEITAAINEALRVAKMWKVPINAQ